MGTGDLVFSGFFELKGHLYFAGLSPATGLELYRLNKNTTTPSLVADLNPGPSHSDPKELFLFAGSLYFRATSEPAGTELYRFDGRSPPKLIDLLPGEDSSSPSGFTEFNGSLYFSASTDGFTRDLFRLAPGSTNPVPIDVGADVVSAQPSDFFVL
jgi:ELWxxDGT repeat protein